MYSGNILDYFPISERMPSIRSGQHAVITEIDKVFKSGKKFIIFEGPVGCGKSGIGMTFARAFGNAHMITPRKSLQNQYYEDFSDDIVLMKGRSSYPCTYGTPPKKYQSIIKLIEAGQIKQPSFNEPNCGSGPCKSNKEEWEFCNNTVGDCPYTVAIKVAQEHQCVIHNIHSFIFQTSFSEKFEKRELLVIDEAHEIESTIRGFISKKFTVGIPLEETDRPDISNDVSSWCDFFMQDRFVPKLSKTEQEYELSNPEWISPKDEYILKIKGLEGQKDYYGNRFVVKSTINKVGVRAISTTFEFIPESLGNAATSLLFEYGEYVILMSGTIYDKGVFCRNLGIKMEDAHFIRISSTFPVDTRPIYAKPEYQVDTSFQMWRENFNEMVTKISSIMSIFHDAKGIIHAPSYDAAQEIVQALPGNRAFTHSSQDFQQKLEEFYSCKEPKVFVSPVCQQGVDFKYDRARFQIITRVPYSNTSDEFINYKVQNDFSWYNYQALIVFGQQIGRVNRAEDDYGATFLLDSRFNKFITRNLKVIPKWIQNSIIWK